MGNGLHEQPETSMYEKTIATTSLASTLKTNIDNNNAINKINKDINILNINKTHFGVGQSTNGIKQPTKA